MAGPKLPEKKPAKDETLTFRPRPGIDARLRRVASRTGWKRHRVINDFLEWALDAWEKENPESPETSGNTKTPR